MNEAILGRRSRSGAVMVMVAISLMALVGIAALAIDIGLLYVAKQNAQNTADQCALSALAAVNDYSTVSIEKTAVTGEVSNVAEYVFAAYPQMTSGADARSASADGNNHFFGRGFNHYIHNNSTAPPIHFYVDGERQFDVSVWVTCTIPVDSTFARVFGATQKAVQANAVARLYSVPCLEYPFAPWAIRRSTIFPPQGGGIEVDTLVIRTLTNPGGTAMNPDGFTAIVIPDTLAYTDQLRGPGAAVKLGTELPPEPPPATSVPLSKVSILPVQGASFNSATSTALIARFGSDVPYSDWKAAGESGSYQDNNRILIVPIVNDTAESDGTSRVVGFAPVFVTEFDSTTGEVQFRLLSATWTGGRLRWGLKPKPNDTTSMVSKITLYDSNTWLSRLPGG